MKIAHTVEELRSYIVAAKASARSIGFVPTMGALHAGHASLLRQARAENDLVVLSIFVNPTQFGPKEDLAKYPRTLPEDSELARRERVDFLFAPSAEEIYPPGFQTFVEVGEIAQPLCGAFRPGHFRGVATVVNRLFQLVEPTRAYFGQKDIQQCLVLLRMVKDFGTRLELKICPTLRDPDGLAMSSRNRYLSAADREKALVIPRALYAAEALYLAGERERKKLLACAREKLSADFQLQYLELLSYPDLHAEETLTGPAVIAVAGFLGSTRLIDNLLLPAKTEN